MILDDCLISVMGISLDFPFWSSDIIVLISSKLQSWRKILDMLELGRYVVKSGIPEMFTLPILSWFILVAMDTKYLLNSFAIARRFTILTLSIINCGLISLRDFPLNSLISSHIFFLSPVLLAISLQ